MSRGGPGRLAVGAFAVYRIHGGSTVCWQAAVEAAVGCGGRACFGVVRVVCGGMSCVVLGGSPLWSAVAVSRGRSSAWRLLGGCGTCGVGMAGGGRACVWACFATLAFFGCGVLGVSALGSLLCLSPAPLFLRVNFVSFFFGGMCVCVCVWLGYGVCGAWLGRGCVQLLVLVWAGWWMGCCALGSLCVCQPSGIRWLSIYGSSVRGALAVSGRRQWWCGACVGGCGSQIAPGGVAAHGHVCGCVRGAGRLGSRHSAAWCGTARGGRGGVAGFPVPRVGGGAGPVCMGEMQLCFRYVCVGGVVVWIGALWVMQRVVGMLLMPTGCCRCRDGCWRCWCCSRGCFR